MLRLGPAILKGSGVLLTASLGIPSSSLLSSEHRLPLLGKGCNPLEMVLGLQGHI